MHFAFNMLSINDNNASIYTRTVVAVIRHKRSRTGKEMKLLLLLVALSCWAAPSVLAGNFVCYYPSWAAQREGMYYFSINTCNCLLNFFFIFVELL